MSQKKVLYTIIILLVLTVVAAILSIPHGIKITKNIEDGIILSDKEEATLGHLMIVNELLNIYESITISSSRTMDFSDDPQFAEPITCNPKILSFNNYNYTFECNPAHHQWLKSKGIDITGTPDGFLFTNKIGGTWQTGVVIFFESPDGSDINEGLSGNETLAINFLNDELYSFVKIKLDTTPIEYNNMPATVIMKAYDKNGILVGNTTKSFTGVTNGNYTPAEIGIELKESKISKITLHALQHPQGGIYIESISIPNSPLKSTADMPPKIEVPQLGDFPSVYGPNVPEYVKVSYGKINAYDDNDGLIAAKCYPPSDSWFKKGYDKVTCTATDSAGNVAKASFLVGVIDTNSHPPLPHSLDDVPGITSEDIIKMRLWHVNNLDQIIQNLAVTDFTSKQTADYMKYSWHNILIFYQKSVAEEIKQNTTEGNSAALLILKNIKSKTDGSIGGNKTDDVIIEPHAQRIILEALDNIISILQAEVGLSDTNPSIQITTPTDGAVYQLNELVHAEWYSYNGFNFTASGDNGSLLDTKTIGEKHFSVNATDIHGNIILSRVVTYYVK